MPAYKLFQYSIHAFSSVTAAIDAAVEKARQGSACHVVTLNPEMLMQATTNPALDQILQEADIALPDGIGVVWALKKRSSVSIQRMPGITFAEALLAQAAKEQWRVALIGAQAGVLSQAISRLTQRYPALDIAYQHHGFFAPVQRAEIAQQCAKANPHVVLVALGVPQQEYWVAQHKALFPQTILVGVGGSFDVWAGAVNRAPRWCQTMHLEWAYRLALQPQRLKRVLSTLPAFVWRVLTP